MGGGCPHAVNVRWARAHGSCGPFCVVCWDVVGVLDGLLCGTVVVGMMCKRFTVFKRSL